MSMISSQCDELRGMADELDERAKAYGPLVHNVLSPMLRQAADTIWELRCKLSGMVDQREEIERLKAESEMPRYDGMDYEELVTAAQFSWMENAKLRDAMYTNAGKHALQHMDEDELRIWATQQSEYIDQLEELVRDMWRFTGTACKKYPRLFDPAAAGGQTVQLNALDAIEQRMRELGVLDE